MSKINKESKEFYLFFLKNLEKISREEHPGHEWEENGYHCFSEFNEMCLGFMSPCEQILTWHVLSNEQRKKLQSLFSMIEEYNEYNNDQKKTDDEIRNDPEWDEIRQYAKKIYADLKNVKFI